LLLPPLGPRGQTDSLAGKGVGGPNSEEGTEALVLCVYYNSSRDTRTNSANTQSSGHFLTSYLHLSIVSLE
jgi:hypothetical protein